jgi:mRNA interferase RelE/StbE
MYTVIYHESIADDLKKITKKDKEKIKKAIEKKLTTNPIIFGEPLRSNLIGYRKLRVGEYRIVYQIKEKEKTLIIIIAHRRNVYGFVKKRIG